MTLATAKSAIRNLSPEQFAAIRTQVAAILNSDSFSSSKRCQDFLKLVVERTLADDQESLTERFLGVELFGRPVDYETATDSIVRVRANDVRRRLGQYYAGESPSTMVRIDLIAGRYVPEFHWPPEAVSPGVVSLAATGIHSPVITGPTEPKVPLEKMDRNLATHQKRSIVLVWGAVAFSVIAVSMVALIVHLHRSNFDRFWQPVLDAPGVPVFSLPTTDTFQLNMDSMRTLRPLNQLKSGESLKIGLGDVIAFHDWHVSLPVVQATLSLALAMERKGKAPLVRMGTDLRRDELRGHPIIAIGSFSNPWTEQNVSGLRFTFDRGASDREPPRIRDSLNPQRSWSLQRTYPDPQSKDYAIVTRTFDPVTREPFVSLAGLHSFGNQIAGEFVSQESSWNEVAKHAPPGWESMNLQIVLETKIIGTTPSSPQIKDVYFWK